jgi:hypothetical protein
MAAITLIIVAVFFHADLSENGYLHDAPNISHAATMTA